MRSDRADLSRSTREEFAARASPVRLAVLGLLIERPAHRYDVVQRFRERIGAAWGMRRSQIYEVVERLERDGLVSVADAGERGSPRPVFGATGRGREVFDAWLRSNAEIDPPPVRNSLFVRLAFLRPEHVHHVLDLIAAREYVLLRSIQEHSDACPELRPSLMATDWPELGLHLILEGTVATLQGELRWLRRARETLEALPVSGSVPPR